MAAVFRDTGRATLTMKDSEHGASMEFQDAMIVTFDGSESKQLFDILMKHVPDMLDLFITKSSEYGSGEQSSGTALGARGQYADIWRKIGKLKIGLWDGNEQQLTTESVDEILRDMIGHCLLALQLRAAEREPKSSTESWGPKKIAEIIDKQRTLVEENAILREKLATGGEFGDWPGRSQAAQRAELSPEISPREGAAMGADIYEAEDRRTADEAEADRNARAAIQAAAEPFYDDHQDH